MGDRGGGGGEEEIKREKDGRGKGRQREGRGREDLESERGERIGDGCVKRSQREGSRSKGSEMEC